MCEMFLVCETSDQEIDIQLGFRIFKISFCRTITDTQIVNDKVH